MDVNGGLNLAVKRMKPKNSGPLSDRVKIFLDTKEGKQNEKKPTSQDARKQKAAAVVNVEKLTSKQDDKVLSQSSKAKTTTSTSPQKDPANSNKEIERHRSAEKILETFQSRDLTTNDWNKLADQVLTRSVKNSAEEIQKIYGWSER